MDSFKIEPKYSTSQVPGKCIKCLAEQELDSCLIKLLSEEGDSEETQKRYEMLIAFLKSPESRKMREESERYLAEGKKVALKLSLVGGKPEYELEVN